MILVTGSPIIKSQGEIRSLPVDRLKPGVFRSFFKRMTRVVPFFSRFFLNHELMAGSQETIVIFDDIATPSLLKRVAKQNPNARLILWYWQPVCDTCPPAKVPARYEKWTYSKSDAAKFGMRRNTQFYVDPSAVEAAKKRASNVETVFDFSFVGKTKNRDATIRKLCGELKELGYSVNWIIVPSSSHLRRGAKNGRLPYRDYLDVQLSSRCVIDICNNEYAGLSMRPLEAAALGKKIITNCSEIAETPLFFKENVYFLQDGFNREKLDAFLNSPFNQSCQASLSQFALEAWAERFR